MSDLIVIGYPDEPTAQTVRQEVVQLEKDYLVDLPDRFLEALRPYGGTVLRTSLTHDAEQQLMKALHGDDRAIATCEHAGSASHA
jgi:uncharacterized membrane protein